MAESTKGATVREAVGVFDDAETMQAAIDELLSSGFDRAELSFVASEGAVREKLGHMYERVEEVEDTPEVVGLPNAEINSPYETHFFPLMVLDGDYASEGNRSARRTPGWEVLPQSGMPLDIEAPRVVPAPAAVNILGDERPEIIAPVADGYVYAWSPDNQELWRYDYAQGAPLGASEAAVVDLVRGQGHAHVPLKGLPWLFTGQSSCEIDVRVEMRRPAVSDGPPEPEAAD